MLVNMSLNVFTPDKQTFVKFIEFSNVHVVLRETLISQRTNVLGLKKYISKHVKMLWESLEKRSATGRIAKVKSATGGKQKNRGNEHDKNERNGGG